MSSGCGVQQLNFNASVDFQASGGGGQASSLPWNFDGLGNGGTAPLAPVPHCRYPPCGRLQRCAGCNGAAESAFVGALLLGCGERVRGCTRGGGARPGSAFSLTSSPAMSPGHNVATHLDVEGLGGSVFVFACTEQFLSNLNSCMCGTVVDDVTANFGFEHQSISPQCQS